MKVQIRDKQALSSISIEGLTSYLQTHEWINEGQWGNRPAVIYTKKHAGRSWDILVPTHTEVGDYASGMAEALAVLATIEDRSQLHIFNDLKIAAVFDVIRLNSMNGIAHAPVSLRRSADLLDGTYRMVAAAADAVENPRAAYSGSHSSEVTEYLENVRQLPEYVEGYSLALYSHVPADIDDEQGFWGSEYDIPFARRATDKLAQALERAVAISEYVANNNTRSPFENAVGYGVSANLCASVANIVEKGKGVEIGIQWAAALPAKAPNAKFRFTEASADVLNKAAEFFRAPEPAPEPSYDEILIAQVVRLDREPDEFDGQADLLTRQDGRRASIRIKVKFAEPDYNKVIQAFKEKREISLRGDIHKVGNTSELHNPRNLIISEQTMRLINDSYDHPH